MTEDKPKSVSVRMSAETKNYLDRQAKRGFRTLNREILLRIEESVQRDRKAQDANSAA